MSQLAITGVGLLLGPLRTATVRDLIAAESLEPMQSQPTEVMLEGYRREAASKVAREDRAILTDVAVQCLLSAIDAFDMAESDTVIGPDVRENFGVFTSAERDREFPAELWHMVHAQEWEHPPTVEQILLRIGSLKERVHPLALFKKLPTNALYHLSKYFQLRGGGYPLQRMSLGGLCMMEEASAKIRNRSLDGAILSAYGNMGSLDNLLAFGKMGLLRVNGDSHGIVPAVGAASILLEPLDQVEARGGRSIAILDRVCSSFHDQMHVGEQEWLDFYRRHFRDIEGTSPIVVCYDNGLADAGQHERSAVAQFFRKPTTVAYKKYTGYTGQPNNLIDLIFALFDPGLSAGRPIILNGIGSSAGMASLQFKKCGETKFPNPTNNRQKP